jgi:hypothetical protein
MWEFAAKSEVEISEVVVGAWYQRIFGHILSLDLAVVQLDSDNKRE